MARHAKGRAQRVLAIGDAHDSPHLPDKSRFQWMGRHANATRPDHIVQIGDWFTFDSCTQHDGNGTIRGRSKPTFRADMKSGAASMDAFNAELSYNPEKYVTLGNHENRADQWENDNPETEGMLGAEYRYLFRSKGWAHTEYGDWLFIGGVGFTHIPSNQLGKAYGGMVPENAVARDAVFDIVFGHTHKDRNVTVPKLGSNNHVRVYNVGSSLPHGHIETYARHSATGWSYGVHDLVIQHGHIRDWAHVSMIELETRYG